MPDKSDSSDDDNQSRKRHLSITNNHTPSKRSKPSGIVAFFGSLLGGMFGSGKQSDAPTERVYEVSDDEDDEDEEIVVVSTSPKKHDPSGPIVFLNADPPRVEAGSDVYGCEIERTEEKEDAEEVIVEKHIQKTIEVSDDSDENEIQEVPVVHAVQNAPVTKPVIKTSEVQQDDELTVQFVKLVKTPNRDLQNARMLQNEIIFLNECQDDDGGSSVQFDTTESAVFESPTPDESVSRPRTPSDWRTSSPYEGGSRNVRDYWRRSTAKKPTVKRTNFNRQLDATTSIKKFATSQIQKNTTKSAKIQEISRLKYMKRLQQCGYANLNAVLEKTKPSVDDLISKAKATVHVVQSRSNTPSILSRESSVIFETRTPAGSRPQTPSSDPSTSVDVSGYTKNENISQLMSKLGRVQLDATQLKNNRYKSICENNTIKVENIGEEARIRSGHRGQSKEDRFEAIRNKLQIQGISIRPPKPKKVKEEFPALPDSAKLLIEKAWTRALSQEELFVNEFSIEIRRKDLLTLNGLNWLNDNIITYYLQLIVQRSTVDSNYPKVYAFNTFFYTNIVDKGYASVKRWTRKVDIFSYDVLLVPVHLGMHWCMAVIDMTRKRVEFYDSLYKGNGVVLPALKGYLASESMDKKKVAFDFSGWAMEEMEDIPRQKNGSDCGVFSCQFGEWAARRKVPAFSQTHMPYYRQRMVHEIVTKKLLATI